ncbi:MAG: porin family protein [Chitinophagaceae bacterium]
MKTFKKLFLLAVCCLSLVTVIAQPKPGIKAGLNYASLSGYDGDRLLSLHAGVFVNQHLGKNWRIQPELLYSGEGQHYITDEGDQTIALSFVSVPVMFQYFPTGNFYIEAGPQLAVIISAQSREAGTHFNLKRSFRNTAFGWNAGAGVGISKNIGVYARYHFGLTDLTLYDNDIDRSQVAQLGVIMSLKSHIKKESKAR